MNDCSTAEDQWDDLSNISLNIKDYVESPLDHICVRKLYFSQVSLLMFTPGHVMVRPFATSFNLVITF